MLSLIPALANNCQYISSPGVQLKYRVDVLETELAKALKVTAAMLFHEFPPKGNYFVSLQVIEDQKESAKVVQSLPEDVAKMNDQETKIQQMSEELGHYKQELIEARAHKSASDDDLGNVKGQLETLQNQITSLSEEGERQMKNI